MIRNWFMVELGLNAGLRVEGMASLKHGQCFFVRLPGLSKDCRPWARQSFSRSNRPAALMAADEILSDFSVSPAAPRVF